MKIFIIARGMVFVLAAAVLTSGCVPTLETPETRFFLLSTLPEGSKGPDNLRANPPMVVDITSLTIPQYLQRPQIVTRVERNRLKLAEFDNWGGNLEKNITRVLAGNLSTLLKTPDVRIATRRRTAGFDAAVELEVMQFERAPSGRAILEAQWRVFGPGRDKAPVISRISRLESDVIPASAHSDATVGAMSELLGRLSRVIAQAISDGAKR